MAVAAPEVAQPFEGPLRQGHVTVAVAFARPDMQEHACGVDVADFQLEGFAQTQTAGIDGRQGDAMIHQRHPGDKLAHLGSREGDGRLELGRGADKLQLGGPNALEGFLPEELDRAERLGGALAGEAPLGLEIDEILAKFFGADQVGRAVKVLGQLTHASPVTLLAAGLERQQCQVVGKEVQDCVRRTFFICIDLSVIVDGLPCVMHGEPSAACGKFGQRPMQNRTASVQSAKPQEPRPRRRVAASFNHWFASSSRAWAYHRTNLRKSLPSAGRCKPSRSATLGIQSKSVRHCHGSKWRRAWPSKCWISILASHPPSFCPHRIRCWPSSYSSSLVSFPPPKTFPERIGGGCCTGSSWARSTASTRP